MSARERPRMFAPALAIVAAGWLCTACDSVGRSLVDTIPEGGTGNLQCQPVQCRAIQLAPLPAAPPADPELEGCTSVTPAVCDPKSETAPGFDRAPPRACRRAISLDSDAFDGEAVRNVSCAQLRMTRSAAGGAGVVRIEDAHWTRVELDIETMEPLALELVNAVLDHVRVRLRGPLTLRVVDSETVDGLGVATDSTTATVELRSASVRGLYLGDWPLATPDGEVSGAFAGTLSVTRSTIAGAQLHAREVSFETVALNASALEVEHAHWVDVTGRAVTLAAGDAVISASQLTEFDVTRCDVMSLHRATLTAYAIARCTGGPTRVIETSLVRGMIDGAIDSDTSTFERSVFGARETTELQLWDTDLLNVNFCAGTGYVAVAGEGSFLCAYCQELDATTVAIDACVHEKNETRFSRSCSALDEAPVCDPTPTRMRPPFN